MADSRTSEAELIAMLRSCLLAPGARDLADDAACLPIGSATLVLTSDMIVEGVHYLPGDPPGDVAWKLVAVNLSDLAAKGARPLGLLLGYSLAPARKWDEQFVAGLATATAAFGAALLGGDTVAARPEAPRTLALTAIGIADHEPPARSGGRAGDHLWVSGSLGDAGAGLRVLNGGLAGEAAGFLVERYRQPRPRLELGQGLAASVHAMMDVSDGLLLDASRLAAASGLAAHIELETLPLSEAFLATLGEDRAARLFAASAGDDYELLFAADPDRSVELLALGEALGVPLSRIGALEAGEGVRLSHDGGPLPLPPRLGWEHGGR